MKNIIYILITILISLNSCKVQEQEIVINEEFLGSHEWMIDSIYGEEEFIQEWIYFTPEKEFYRFSKYQKSYIVDSALTWSENQIIENDQEIFRINAIDSYYIKLKGLDKTYRAKRWNEFDQTDIERYLESNKYKLIINGRWMLDSMGIGKSRIPSFCKELTPGAIFDFKDDGRFIVYQRDSTNSCNEYSCFIYKDEISFSEWDILMSFPIEKLEPNSLVIISNYIPRDSIWKEEYYMAKKNGYKMYFTKFKN